MKFEDLKLAHGYPLQLQMNNSAGQPERYSSRLIGCLPGRSILLSVPRLVGKLARFRTGQKIIVRMMIDNGIGIFASIVETQTAEPYPILHVSYPEQVSFKGIRGATRVTINLPVTVKNISTVETTEAEGEIADISISGARMELKDAIAEIGENVQINAKISILGIERELIVNAIIRSRLERSTQEIDKNLPAIYGLEFNEEGEERRLLLYAFVYNRIAEDQQLQWQ